jgi:hypothetical protein
LKPSPSTDRACCVFATGRHYPFAGVVFSRAPRPVFTVSSPEVRTNSARLNLNSSRSHRCSRISSTFTTGTLRRT